MEKQRGAKILSIVALLVAVAGLTVAFAAMSQTLTINGTATMDTATWDIHFVETSLEEAHTGAATATTPELTGTNFGDYEITVTKPGDSYTYTFDVTNAGTIDAYLSDLTLGDVQFEDSASNVVKMGDAQPTEINDAWTVMSNMTYTFTYADDSTIAEGDKLAAGETKTLKIYVTYNESATVLPAGDVTISGLSAQLVYSQDMNQVH